MSEASDVADQLVKMSMEGAEVAVKITGSAAKEVALLIASAIKEGVNQSGKTHGKERLGSMLKSGKELKVFAVQQKDLKEFTEHAKQYGILYCVLKDKNGKDTGMTDIIARAEDASKIQRIFDKYGLGKVERSTVKAESEKEPEKEPEGKTKETEKTGDGKADKEKEEEGKAEKEKSQKPNPGVARTGKDRPSEPDSTTAATRGEGKESKEERPSVKEKLDRYKAEAAKETANEQKTKNKSKER